MAVIAQRIAIVSEGRNADLQLGREMAGYRPSAACEITPPLPQLPLDSSAPPNAAGGDRGRRQRSLD